MATIKLFRQINKGEVYVASERTIKKRLQDIDIDVFFGMYRYYHKNSDIYSRHASNAKEKNLSSGVVASVSISARNGLWTTPGMMLFYPVKLGSSSDKLLMEYESRCLQKTIKWYLKVISSTPYRDGEKTLVVSLDSDYVFTEI